MAVLPEDEMERDIQKLKDSLDEEITPFGSLAPAPE